MTKAKTKPKKKRTNSKKASKKASSTRKGSTLSRDLLGRQDVECLLLACGDGEAAARNRALIALLDGTGMRIGEALALEEKDLDLNQRRAHVRNGKGSKSRHVWVSKRATKPIKAWLKVRAAHPSMRKSPIFCSLAGRPLSLSYVRRVLPKLGEAAGISKRVHSHALRHAFACEAHRRKVSLRALQLQLGHSSISATSTYLERIGLPVVFGDFNKAFS